jgi:hypothetical protein
MDLILPDFGLLVWTGLTFSLLFFLLAKFAWKPILNSVNAREQKISEALELAEKTKTEMSLETDRARVLGEAIKALYGRHPLDIVTKDTVIQDGVLSTVAKILEEVA